MLYAVTAGSSAVQDNNFKNTRAQAVNLDDSDNHKNENAYLCLYNVNNDSGLLWLSQKAIREGIALS